MARRARDLDPLPVHVPRSITAASRRLDLNDRQQTGAIKAQDWQTEAWTYFDEVPEVKFASRFIGACMSRLRLFPGIVVDPDEDPVPLQDVAGSELPNGLAEAALDEWQRLDAWQSSLNREWGVILTVSGDSYLVVDDDPETEEETWNVYSESTLKVIRKPTNEARAVLGVQDQPGGRPRQLGEAAEFYRIWRRHPVWPGMADSNVRSIRAECEELLIYSRQFRAVGKSRNNAGLLFLPLELEQVTPDPAKLNEPTDLELRLMQSLITPVSDDGSASAVVPHILRGRADLGDAIKHIALDRKIDERAVERVNYLIGRVAHGVDLPPEVLTGMGDVNHWSAWQISDETYKAHIEPVAMIPAHEVPRVVLWPALISQGRWNPADVRRVVLGIDPGNLVTRPNRGQDSKDLYDRWAISWEALRRHNNFADTDAPSPEEFLARLAFERGIGGVQLTRDLLQAIGYDEAIPEEPAPAPAEGGGDSDTPAAEDDQPIPDTQDNGDAARARLRALAGRAVQHLALTAASAEITTVGQRLTAIDQRLRDRLQVAASDAIADALRVAGNRLRARAQGDPGTAAQVPRTVAPEDVAATLGAEVAGGLASTDELLAGGFDQLADRWRVWVDAANAETVRVLRSRAVAANRDPEDVDRAVEAFEVEQEDDREAGWLLLFAALRSLAVGRMFTPDGTPDDGEFDPTLRVQAGTIREALVRAGGGTFGQPAGQAITALAHPGGGIATGRRVMRALVTLRHRVQGWEWHVGAPTVPFLPHQRLSGVTFTDWQDEQLTNGTGWPAYGHYFPGDHRGCQCDAVPIIIRD